MMLIVVVTVAVSLLVFLGASAIGMLLALPLRNLFVGPGAGRATWVVAGALVGSVVAVVCFVILFMWYVLRFLFVAPVLAVEELGARATFRRTGQLVSGRIGPGFSGRVKIRATVVVTAMMVVLLVVTSLGAVPSTLVTFAYSKPWDLAHYNPSAIPERLLVPSQLFQICVQSLFGPLYLALTCIFYVDMRVRREGLDLELKLKAFQQNRSAA
jgi:hypothetical protein